MKTRHFDDSSKKSKSALRKNDDVIDRPDPNRRDFYFDNIDDFHHSKEKIYLDKAKAVDSDSSDEEVYKLAANNSEDEVEEDNEDVDDMQSDIEDNNEDYLPSAKAWGKNRKTFYNTDYVDKDYGGLSESDEEAAQLEEIEAKNMQKRLAEQMNEDDFRLNDLPPTSQSTKDFKKKSEEQNVDDVVDVSKLNDTEKLDFLYKKNPELSGLIEEYQEKTLILENQLKPVVDALVNGKLPHTKPLNFIRIRFDAYMNYLLNLNFYFIMKASHTSVHNHPVIDRIMEWKKVVTSIDEKCVNLQADLNTLCEKLSNGDHLSTLTFAESDESVGEKSKPNIKPKSRSVVFDDEPIEEDNFYDFQDKEDGQSDKDEKRAATYEMLKNKGTTPKRKKENRNPRVKHRKKFEKALHKKRSQVPDVKRELYKYGGEERGIKPNLVKSVKLH